MAKLLSDNEIRLRLDSQILCLRLKAARMDGVAEAVRAARAHRETRENFLALLGSNLTGIAECAKELTELHHEGISRGILKPKCARICDEVSIVRKAVRWVEHMVPQREKGGSGAFSAWLQASAELEQLAWEVIYTRPNAATRAAISAKTPTRIGAESAVLDVTRGRRGLAKRMMSVEGQPTERLPVTISGYLTRIFGSDDGISQEFAIEVSAVKVLA